MALATRSTAKKGVTLRASTEASTAVTRWANVWRSVRLSRMAALTFRRFSAHRVTCERKALVPSPCISASGHGGRRRLTAWTLSRSKEYSSISRSSLSTLPRRSGIVCHGCDLLQVRVWANTIMSVRVV